MCELGQRESWSGRCQLREAKRALAPGGACVRLLLLIMSFYSVFLDVLFCVFGCFDILACLADPGGTAFPGLDSS